MNGDRFLVQMFCTRNLYRRHVQFAAVIPVVASVWFGSSQQVLIRSSVRNYLLLLLRREVKCAGIESCINEGYCLLRWDARQKRFERIYCLLSSG